MAHRFEIDQELEEVEKYEGPMMGRQSRVGLLRGISIHEVHVAYMVVSVLRERNTIRYLPSWNRHMDNRKAALPRILS